MAKPAVKEHFEKVKKPKKPKAEIKLAAPGVGHNSGEVIPEIKEKITEYLESWQRQKSEAKLQRDIKAHLKQQYHISAAVFSHEIRLQKMASDARIQFESGHHDLKTAIGYQAELDLAPGTVARTEEEYANPSTKSSAETLQRDG